MKKVSWKKRGSVRVLAMALSMSMVIGSMSFLVIADDEIVDVEPEQVIAEEQEDAEIPDAEEASEEEAVEEAVSEETDEEAIAAEDAAEAEDDEEVTEAEEVAETEETAEAEETSESVAVIAEAPVYAAAPDDDPGNIDGDSNGTVGYQAASYGYDVYGSSPSVKSTYNNGGYKTVVQFGDDANSRIRIGNGNFRFNKWFDCGNEVYVRINAEIDGSGNAVVATYEVINAGSSATTVRLGSWADCQVGTGGAYSPADKALVRFTSNGLKMENPETHEKYYLIPGNGSFDTKWCGGLSSLSDNLDVVFTNATTDQYGTSVDSALAWSWKIDLAAGQTVVKKAILTVGEVATYMLSFDANGGEGTMDDVEMISGVSSSLPGNTFTKACYGFAGWAESADATTPVYADKDQISISSAKTLYAVWKPIEYSLLSGGNSTWTNDSTDPLAFSATRNYDDAETPVHFTGIQVDGVDVDPANFTTENGGIIVKLNPDFLKTLTLDETHTLTFLFDDGNNVDAQFTLKAPVAAPQTGEYSSPLMLAVAGLMIAAGAAFVVKSRKA